MEPLSIFEKFKLDEVDKNWVNHIWDNEFVDFDNIPGDLLLFIENDDMEDLLRDTCNIVSDWVKNNANCTNKNNENNENVGGGGDGATADDNERVEVSWQTLRALNVDQRSLLALLGFIISRGQKMDADEDSRQACLLATSLYLRLLAIPGSDVFQVYHENLYQTVINTLQLSEHLVTPVKKQKKSIEDIESYYECEDMSNSLSQNEKKTLIEGLNVIMYNFITMLDTWFLKNHLRSLETTIHSLIELTKLSNDNNNKIDSPLGSLRTNAYGAMIKLCDKRHGHVDSTIKLILRNMLPHMLSSYNNNLSTKALNIVRETTINFIKKLLQDYEYDCENGIHIFIQHLMLNCQDRCELRQKQAVIIVKLLNICEINDDLYKSIIRDLILLSHQNKISLRVFSQEIINKCFKDPLLKYKKVLLATVLTRCIDVSNTVRGRAMSTLAEYTNDDDNPFVKDLFQTDNNNNLGLPELPDLEISLLDDSSEILPDVNTIINILKHRIEDERAFVRRNAIQIIRNACIIKPELLYTFLNNISDHCLDPAMIVRNYSITVLSQFLQTYYNYYPDLYKIWVKSVVPQIFDIEIKVQEQVIKVMENLIIDNVKDKHNNLTWSIINELIINKMKKHFIKACEAWLNNGTIDDNFVLKIRLNLSTSPSSSKIINDNNDISIWFFLSTISENKQINNINEYFEDYESIFTSNDMNDCYLRYLKLEVLKNSWRTFDDEFLIKLSQDIYNYLEKLTIDYLLINISLDILAYILKHLGGDELNEKMKSLILNSERILEDIIQPINHSGDKINEYLKAMSIMGYASVFGSHRLTISTIRVLQGILIDWQSMSIQMIFINELQAVAVIVLGEQGRRDEKIAYEVMPIFGELLRDDNNLNKLSKNVAVKVNAVKAIAGICTRFTGLVEPYLPNICLTMKRGCKIIKETIVIIFIQLLVEDYIKVKGTFFYHILTMLSDSDEYIREMTIFLIKERLLIKDKTLISQQFISSVFHYNNFDLNDIKSNINGNVKTNQLNNELILSGNINETKRYMIYDFMLDHLDLPGKLKVIYKLTQIVIFNFIKNNINIKNEKGYCLLKDTFYILSNEHLQPSSIHKFNNNDDECEDDITQSEANDKPINRASNVIFEGIKKHNLEVLLPNLLEVKRKLETCKLSSDVGKLIGKIGLEFTKDQLSSLYPQYPELEKELNSNIKKCGKKAHQTDDTTETERSNLYTPIRKAQNHPLLNSARVPKIVLRKLPFSDDDNSLPGPSNINKHSDDKTTPRTSKVPSRKLSFSTDSSEPPNSFLNNENSNSSDNNFTSILKNNSSQYKNNESSGSNQRERSPSSSNKSNTPRLYDFDFLNN